MARIALVAWEACCAPPTPCPLCSSLQARDPHLWHPPRTLVRPRGPASSLALVSRPLGSLTGVLPSSLASSLAVSVGLCDSCVRPCVIPSVREQDWSKAHLAAPPCAWLGMGSRFAPHLAPPYLPRNPGLRIFAQWIALFFSVGLPSQHARLSLLPSRRRPSVRQGHAFDALPASRGGLAPLVHLAAAVPPI